MSVPVEAARRVIDRSHSAVGVAAGPSSEEAGDIPMGAAGQPRWSRKGLADDRGPCRVNGRHVWTRHRGRTYETCYWCDVIRTEAS